MLLSCLSLAQNVRAWPYFTWPKPTLTAKVHTCMCAPITHAMERIASSSSAIKLPHYLGCSKAALKPHCFEGFFAFHSAFPFPFHCCFFPTSCTSVVLSFGQLFFFPGIQSPSLFILPSQPKPMLLLGKELSSALPPLSVLVWCYLRVSKTLDLSWRFRAFLTSFCYQILTREL